MIAAVVEAVTIAALTTPITAFWTTPLATAIFAAVTAVTAVAAEDAPAAVAAAAAEPADAVPADDMICAKEASAAAVETSPAVPPCLRNLIKSSQGAKEKTDFPFLRRMVTSFFTWFLALRSLPFTVLSEISSAAAMLFPSCYFISRHSRLSAGIISSISLIISFISDDSTEFARIVSEDLSSMFSI